ncbi:23015_t:CDS:2 [Gigaspora margarita]|uniref:23015_t:CDS:1 n=1 Tax=Gigaspora margarita TaxID=4874 RepID=A0ABN7UIY4_GIGMA|nr:23015_t:CDS:2 [Gigaspora margarita]
MNQHKQAVLTNKNAHITYDFNKNDFRYTAFSFNTINLLQHIQDLKILQRFKS